MYNAGNAWFFSGEIGRAIASYKQARIYRPFDPLIRENLKSTRALAVDVVDSLDRPAWSSWPLRWVALILILSALLFWALLLAYVRYRSRRVLVATLTVATAFTSLAALTSYNSLIRNPEGVIIVPEVYARKGPGYTYHTAFHEPLHDCLEFQLLEARDAWLQIRLSDGRSCWIPKSQAEIIRSTIQ